MNVILELISQVHFKDKWKPIFHLCWFRWQCKSMQVGVTFVIKHTEILIIGKTKTKKEKKETLSLSPKTLNQLQHCFYLNCNRGSYPNQLSEYSASGLSV